MAPPLEPLRICFVGQTGSGKSSIINALVDAMVAEPNPLPQPAQQLYIDAGLTDGDGSSG
ncbi:MAG: GTPase domain-containing protein [Desulfotignum sp.]|nr:GTPase domain-containing protein [Desulfotignum sp.]